jgi:hypothetical protein
MQTAHQSLTEVPGAPRHKNCHFAASLVSHRAKLGNNTDKKRAGQHEIRKMTGAGFVQGGAAMYHELRKRGASAANLEGDLVGRQSLHGRRHGGVHHAIGKHFLLRLFEHNRLSDLTNELVGGNPFPVLGVLVRFRVG